MRHPARSKLADLAALTDDYLTVPTEASGRIRSLLTMVGGRVVYALKPSAVFEEASDQGGGGTK